MRPCWSCHKEITHGNFCPFCNKIQPVVETDYFEILRLPRKLNLPAEMLEERFHELSRKLHPDYFLRKSEDEQNYSMQHSSRLNDAYRTLKDTGKRVDYLLSLYGARPQTTQQSPPPELLEEVFDATEKLAALEEAGHLHHADLEEKVARLLTIRTTLAKRRSDLDSELEGLGREWDAAAERENSTASHNLLKQLQQNQLHRIFISNLIRRIDEGIARNAQSSGN